MMLSWSGSQSALRPSSVQTFVFGGGWQQTTPFGQADVGLRPNPAQTSCPPSERPAMVLEAVLSAPPGPASDVHSARTSAALTRSSTFAASTWDCVAEDAV